MSEALNTLIVLKTYTEHSRYNQTYVTRVNASLLSNLRHTGDKQSMLITCHHSINCMPITCTALRP